MSLAARLDGIREGFLKRVPKEVVETMERATADLRGSGILDRVVKVGDVAPAFVLENDRGETIRSEDLLRKGPLVLSFYRGVW